MAALTVVNSVGDVLSADGTVIAGGGGGAIDGMRGGPGEGQQSEDVSGDSGPKGVENTTLSVIATDAPLSRVDLGRVARMASTGLARRISPVNTPFDGDVTFAVSPARPVAEMDPQTVLGLGVAARDALESAIEAAVTRAP